MVRLESLGVHEHWNNAADKQYSRNLETGDGIELIFLHSDVIKADINSDGNVDMRDLFAMSENWLEYGDANDMDADLNKDQTVDFKDWAILGKDWGTVTRQQ